MWHSRLSICRNRRGKSMKKQIFILLIFLLTAATSVFAQDASDGKIGFGMADSAFEKPGMTMFTGSEFLIKNTDPGSSSTLADFSFWTGARVALSYNWDFYTIAPFFMTQIYMNMTPKVEIEDGVYYSKTSTLILRSRTQFGFENKFKINDALMFTLGLLGRLQVDFDSVNLSNSKYIPEIRFTPSLTLNGSKSGVAYFFSYSLSPDFYIGSSDYSRFKDNMEMAAKFSLEYNFLPLLVSDPDYACNIISELSYSNTFTKNDSLRSEAAKLQNALGFSSYEVEYVLGVRGKADRIIPQLGLWTYSRDSVRINDKVVNNIFMGAKVGLGFSGDTWTFSFDYKGGRQVNTGSAVYFIPQRNWNKMSLSASMRL